MISSINFSKLSIKIDKQALANNLNKLRGEEWVDHVNQDDYNGAWKILPLRCKKKHIDDHQILQAFALEGAVEWVDLPVLKRSIEINNILSQLNCPIKSVRLMSLFPGAKISPHRDPGLCMEFGEARLHIPIETSDQVDFLVANTRVPMNSAELWYINADQIHEVENRGKEPRINLVIDCEVNQWLKNEISSNAI